MEVSDVLNFFGGEGGKRGGVRGRARRGVRLFLRVEDGGLMRGGEEEVRGGGKQRGQGVMRERGPKIYLGLKSECQRGERVSERERERVSERERECQRRERESPGVEKGKRELDTPEGYVVGRRAVPPKAHFWPHKLRSSPAPESRKTGSPKRVSRSLLPGMFHQKADAKSILASCCWTLSCTNDCHHHCFLYSCAL